MLTHGKTPDGPADGVFALGSGVAVGMGPNLHRGLTKRLIKAAKADDIGYSLEVMEGDHRHERLDHADRGVRDCSTALLSIPEKSMHTPVEVVKLSDVEAAADLIAAFLREFDGEAEE